MLRSKPTDKHIFNGSCALQHEVVEVVNPSSAPKDGYVWVRLALTGAEGWLKAAYLKSCPEGTADHGRLSADSKTGDRKVGVVELQPHDIRFKEVNERVFEASGGQLAAEGVRFITGHFLGETGMVHGTKEVLFHGTQPDVVDSITRTGFNDEYSFAGKFGPGIYFSPEAMTAYGYGHELFLCEVVLGSESQRVTAEECTQEHTWQSLLRDGKRSVQCHRDRFGQEERIVYHCTQCKPVYVVKVTTDLNAMRKVPAAVAAQGDGDELKRWMEHERTDSIPKTSLREQPDDNAPYVKNASALNGEVVEVLPLADSGKRETRNGYAFVRLSVGKYEGWLKTKYMRDCPDGTRDHGRLCGDLGRKGVLVELKPSDSRWSEIQTMITATHCSVLACHCRGRTIQAKRMWFVRGLYLGETGMKTGPKEVLFHGTKDAAVHQICETGFDDQFSGTGAFGKGLYFSPQSCKAWSYAENHLMVCEVALGAAENRLTMTQRDQTLTYEGIMAQGKRSVQCHAGAPFNHEERIVYKSTQCRPVYLVETTETSPGGGV